MSAPQTNVDTQVKRHRPSILGISGVLIFSTILLILFIMFVVNRGGEPEGAATQVDGRTGEEVPAEAVPAVEGN